MFFTAFVYTRFFEYNKSLCENVGSARSVDRNSKIIIIIIIIIITK